MNTVLTAIAGHAAVRPNARALTTGHSDIAYGELHRAVGSLADRARWKRRSTVAIALDNGPAWALADLALLASGCICVPLPPFFSAAQQAHALRDAGAHRLLTDRPAYYDSLLQQYGIDAIRVEGVELSGKRVAQFALRNRRRPMLPAGTIKVTYTSGTTGTPKGVCLGASAINDVTASLVIAAGLGTGDRHLALLPLCTLLENIAGLYATLTAGGCTILMQPPAGGLALRAEGVAGALQAHRATTAITVPEMLSGLCAALDRGAPRPAALRFLAVGGARVSVEVLRRAAAVGLPVYEGYGLSECGSVVAVNTPHGRRFGSVGRVLPHAQVDLAADGEIHVRGPTLLGYTGERPFSRSWYATGDIGRMDADGYLYVTGRKSDVFITSYGRNVAPEWVESELRASAAIAQAWVYGEGRPWNVAVITPHECASAASVDAAVAAANDRLPDYARVRRWVRSAEPFSASNAQLTTNGRLRRPSLLARYGHSLHSLFDGEHFDVSR